MRRPPLTRKKIDVISQAIHLAFYEFEESEFPEENKAIQEARMFWMDISIWHDWKQQQRNV